jgi:hypothetical protein
MRPSTPPGCLPLVTKLLGELPVPKRILGSFKRVADIDYQIRGQCFCFPSDGRPIALGREPKKIEGGQ